MFKRSTAQWFLPLLMFVFMTSVHKLHAQSSPRTHHSAVVTGGDPEPPGEPDVVTGGDPEPPGEPDVVTGGDPEPPGEPDVVTGGDPEPPGEPDGIMLLHSFAATQVVVLRLS